MPTANFTGSQEALFSPAQVRALMAAEFERARRYGEPLAGLLIGVDRLGQLTDFYGYEAKAEILEAIAELMNENLRAGDFLGCRIEDSLLLILPYTGRDGARALARRILSGARALVFEGGGRTLRVSVSISAAYSDNPSSNHFSGLLEVTGNGLRAATEDGGDRFIEWKPVESDFDRLRRDLEDRIQSLRSDLPGGAPREAASMQDIAPAPLAVATPAAPASEEAPVAESVPSAPQELSLSTKLRSLLDAQAAEGQEDSAALQSKIQELLTQHNRQIDVLERRISKLTRNLELTEDELKRMSLLKDVDVGVASIYRDVQGLNADSESREAKKHMMANIFEANLELQTQINERARKD